MFLAARGADPEVDLQTSNGQLREQNFVPFDSLLPYCIMGFTYYCASSVDVFLASINILSSEKT